MKEDTKTCNLFESEIEALIIHHSYNVSQDISGRLDRMNYLYKRLKEFKKADVQEPAPQRNAQDAAANTTGWR